MLVVVTKKDISGEKEPVEESGVDSSSEEIKSAAQTDDINAVYDLIDKEPSTEKKVGGKKKSSKKDGLNRLLDEDDKEEEEEDAPEESPIVKDTFVWDVGSENGDENESGGESSSDDSWRADDSYGDVEEAEFIENINSTFDSDVQSIDGDGEDVAILHETVLEKTENHENDSNEDDDDFVDEGLSDASEDSDDFDEHSEDEAVRQLVHNLPLIKHTYVAIPSDDEEDDEEDEDFNAEDYRNGLVYSEDDLSDDGLDDPAEFDLREKDILDEDSDDESVDFDEDSDGDNDTLPSDTCTCSTTLLKLYGTELNDDQESLFSESEEQIDEDGVDSCVCYTTKKRSIDEVLFDLSEGVDEVVEMQVKRRRLEENKALKRILIAGGVGAAVGGVATFLGLALAGSP